MRALAIATALFAVACSHPAPTGPVVPPPKAPGYLGNVCAGVPLYVSSGNPQGKCHAQVDDVGGQMVAMACDDGVGNEAKLTCKIQGSIHNRTSVSEEIGDKGIGLCDLDSISGLAAIEAVIAGIRSL